MSFCKRLLASFLAASLALGVFCPVQAYAADRETPAQWAAWIGEALANGFTDLVHSFQPAANISGVAAWSMTYGTSAAMAQAVRDLPEYKELYGSNPLDHSTVIHSYDGGEMVSILDPSGLYSAYLWLHEGVPPYDDSGSSGSGSGEVVTEDGAIYVLHVNNLVAGTYTFTDGTTVNVPSSFVDACAARGASQFVAVSGKSSQGGSIGWNGTGRINGSFAVNINPLFNRPAAAALDNVGASWGVCLPGPVDRLEYVTDSGGYLTNNYGAVPNGLNGFPDWYPSGYNGAVLEYGAYGNSVARYSYVLTNVPVYSWGYLLVGDEVGPSPAPEPVPPVGPSSPDIQNPEPPDVPESDGPIQYNTTTNVTVTLPDGSTTIVEAPTVDTLPIVHWLSIINSNLVAWSSTIHDMVDGWLANISQWLQEIYSELEAFKLSVDTWAVALLSSLDKLGGDWPMSSEDNTNYWNNVTVVNNDIWSGAPDLNAVNVVADDFERLKGKFPVSIPWDLAAILLLFKADPVTPSFSVPLVYFDGSTQTETLDVDLEPFDGVMATWRRLVFIAFAGALALKSKDLLDNFAEVFNIV